MQPYLVSNCLSQKEVKTLTAFRSQCTRGIRSNFRKMYKDLNCPLKCDITPCIDNQEHILTCSKLNTHKQSVVLSNILGTIEEQVQVYKVLATLIGKRNSLLEVETTIPTRSNPGPERSLSVPNIQ